MSKAKSGKVSPDLDTPTDLPQEAVDKISAALNTLLADAFALVEHQMIVVEMPASRSLRPGARSRDPLAQPTLRFHSLASGPFSPSTGSLFGSLTFGIVSSALR